MPERTTWAVKGFFADNWDDLGGWEPFGTMIAHGEPMVLAKQQVFIEDEKSSVHHELTFAERHGDPED